MKKVKQLMIILIGFFVLGDFIYSFVQFYLTPIDGDFAGGVVPANDVLQILRDPTGLSAVMGENYPNPNRFFAHFIFYEYFNLIPDALRYIGCNPIKSLYLSSAIIKVLIQLGFVLIISKMITGSKSIWCKKSLFAIVLIVPLFQTYGYRGLMGIIDPSVTYTFFYALPCLGLLFFYYPLFMHLYWDRKLSNNWKMNALRILFILALSLSGPLNPGIILVVSVLITIGLSIRNYHSQGIFAFLKSTFAVHRKYFMFIVVPALFAFYSLFIGQFNSVNELHPYRLTELYSKLPTGLFTLLTGKIGFPILLITIVINLLILGRKAPMSSQLRRFARYMILFSVLYLLLLPLGGYREYRPMIVRYDTFMPITLMIILLFGISTYMLIKHLKSTFRLVYITLISGILLIFTLADTMNFTRNDCEIRQLERIAESPEHIVELNEDCNVLSWQPIVSPEQSNLNAELLLKLGIVDEKKLYYYHPKSGED